MPDCNCSELPGGTLSSSVNSRFGRRDEVCVGVRPSPHDPFTLSAPTLRRGVSKGPHNSVFGRGREQHRWKGVAPALRYAPALHRRYSGRVVCVGHSSLNGYPDPDSLLTGKAGVTDCLRCHGGAPCRGWIPAFGGTTVRPSHNRHSRAGGNPAWGFPARNASHLRHAVSHRGSHAKVSVRGTDGGGGFGPESGCWSSTRGYGTLRR